MKLENIEFHCKARPGHEKVIFDKDTPAVVVGVYTEYRTGRKRVAFTFYNYPEIKGKRCSFGYTSNRVYFKFTNDFEGYKLSGEKAFNCRFMDDRFLKFVRVAPYIIQYDNEAGLHYIEASPVKSIICKR